MAKTHNIYSPKQDDWLDFDPSRGREITKGRSGLVVSSDAFNQLTEFVVICPITSKIRDYPTNFTLNNYQTHGQIITSQMASYDWSADSHRNIELIEQLRFADLLVVKQMVDQIFE